MRLKEDNSSWRARGIIRRDFRHDPGMPESEVPRHRNKKRKKHVHDYKQVTLRFIPTEHTFEINGFSRTYASHHFVTQEICQGCGHHRTRY